jgi:hypothetical protein
MRITAIHCLLLAANALAGVVRKDETAPSVTPLGSVEQGNPYGTMMVMFEDVG